MSTLEVTECHVTRDLDCQVTDVAVFCSRDCHIRWHTALIIARHDVRNDSCSGHVARGPEFTCRQCGTAIKES